MTLLFTLHYSNKENEPTSLNGTVPPTTHRLKDTSKNPYSKSYCKPRSSSAMDPHSCPSSLKAPSNLKLSRTSTTDAITKHGSNSSSLATIEEEEETSPIIRRILEQTGCASRQELLAKRAAQEANTNGSKSTTSESTMSKANASKAKANPNGSKTITNASKSMNASKSTNGSKSMTNSKKKAKGKHFY